MAALCLARQWARRHRVDYLTSHFNGLRRREIVDGVNVFRVPVSGRKTLATASVTSMLSFPVNALEPGLRLCARRGYDVINTHFALPSGPLGAALAMIGRIPNVLSVHGADVYDPTRRLSPHAFWPTRLPVRVVLARASRIVAQSSDTAGNVLNYYGEDLRSRLSTVPLPFEPPPSAWRAERGELREGLELDDEGFYLVSVGRLIERKGYDRLIRSLTSLPEGFRLILIGRGPLRERLESLARRENVDARVRFAGYVPEREKYEYLQAADVYVLSSHHEGFGIVLQEAMWTGLPIVAASHGGQTDLLEHEVNALLTDSNAPEVLAGAVRRLAGDASLRQRMGRRNGAEVRRYAPEKIADRYVSIFREVISEARAVG